MSLGRKIFFFALMYLLIFLLLEAVFRMLPVQQSMGWLPVNEANPVRRFEPNRSFTWSKDWNFRLVNRLRTNNYGFLSQIDYEPQSALPLAAIIGDSTIEAAMVDQNRTAAAVLNETFASRRRIYAFGTSGAQLSSYIAYARFARTKFRPDRYIFLLIGNDFDESLASYGVQPGAHYFVEDDRGRLTLERFDYEVGFFKKYLRKSALFMYVNANLQVIPRIKTAMTRIQDALEGRKREYVGQTRARVDSRLETDSKRAIDAFLDLLEEACGVPRRDILIAIDGMRPHLYDPEGLKKAEGSYFSDMRRYVLARARALGHPVLDMQPVFLEDFRVNRQFFEYPQYQDGHWNERAHELFARQLIRSGVLD